MKIGLLSTYNDPILGVIIHALLDAGININGVFFDDKASSEKDLSLWRERTNNLFPQSPLWFSPFSPVPFYFCRSHIEEDFSDFIKKENYDILVNAGTPNILKMNTLNAPSIGVLNIHPADIEIMRGCTNVEWAIFLENDIFVTAHLMTEEIDFGPIILKEKVDIHPNDSYVEIRIKTYKMQIECLVQALHILKKNKINIEMPKKGLYYKPIDNESFKKVINR